MAQQVNIVLSKFASNLFVNTKKRYLEKIIRVRNHHLTPIDLQQMAVLLLVQRTDIANKLSSPGETIVHFSEVGFDNTK